MRRRYGDSARHLIVHAGLFALAAYAVVQIFAIDDTGAILLWLAGAVLLHDAIMWPLYSGAATVTGRALGGASNYLRVPLGLSLLIGLAFLATVSGRGEGTYTSVSGRTWDGYLARWLIVSAALFAIAGAAFLLRRRRD